MTSSSDFVARPGALGSATRRLAGRRGPSVGADRPSWQARTPSRLVLAALLVIASVGQAAAQGVPLQLIPTRHAIGPIRGVAVDGEGMFWIATVRAVRRGDGRHFERFEASEDRPGGEVLRLAATPGGRVWLATTEGLARYEGDRFRVLEGTTTPAERPSGPLVVTSKVLAFATGEGRTLVLVEDPEEGAPRRRTIELPDDVEGTIRFMAPGPGHGITLGTESALAWVDPRRGTLRRLTEIGPPAERPRALATAGGRLLVATERSLWTLGDEVLPKRVATLAGRADRFVDVEAYDEGFLALSSRGNLLHVAGAPPGIAETHMAPEVLGRFAARDLWVDQRGIAWIAAGRGGLLRREPDGSWRYMQADDAAGLGAVNRVYGDRQGGVWLEGSQRLARVTSPALLLYRLAGAERVTALGRADSPGPSPFVVGSAGGLYLLTPTGRFHPATGLPGLDRPIIGLAWQTQLTLVLVFSDGEDWHLGELTLDGDHPSTLRLSKPLGEAGAFRAIRADRRGRVWIGTTEGLFDLEGTTLTLRPAQGTGGVGSVSTLHLDLEGRLWVGAATGLWMFRDQERRHWTRATGLRSNRIGPIAEGLDGHLFVSYRDARGIAELDSDATGAAGGIEHPAAYEDLEGTVIRALATGLRGELWVGTTQGLLQVGPEGARRWGRAEGLPSELISPDALYRDRDGTIWIGTDRGVHRLLPWFIERPPEARLVLTGLEVNRSRVEPGQSVIAERATLTARVTWPTWRPPEDLHFVYRLSGLLPTWVDAGREGVLSIGAIPPGAYDLDIEARDGQGNTLGPTLRRHLVIYEPPSYHPWIAAMSVLLLAGLGALLVHRRLASEKRRRLRLEALATAQSREIEDLNSQLDVARARLAGVERELERRRQLAEDLGQLGEGLLPALAENLLAPLRLVAGTLADRLASERNREAPDRDGDRGQALPLLRQLTDDLVGETGSKPLSLETGLEQTLLLLRRLEDLVDLGRLSGGSWTPELRRVDLAAELRSLAAPFASLAGHRGVTLEMLLPERPVAIPLDWEVTGGLVARLLFDAFRAARRGDVVSLAVHRQPGRAEIVVTLPRPPAATWLGPGPGPLLRDALVASQGGEVHQQTVEASRLRIAFSFPMASRQRVSPVVAPQDASRSRSVLLPPVAETSDDGRFGSVPEEPADILVATVDSTVGVYLAALLEGRYRAAALTLPEACRALGRGGWSLVLLYAPQDDPATAEAILSLRQCATEHSIPLLVLRPDLAELARPFPALPGVDGVLELPFSRIHLGLAIEGILEREALRREVVVLRRRVDRLPDSALQAWMVR